jgi:hypothetical protein
MDMRKKKETSSTAAARVKQREKLKSRKRKPRKTRTLPAMVAKLLAPVICPSLLPSRFFSANSIPMLEVSGRKMC